MVNVKKKKCCEQEQVIHSLNFELLELKKEIFVVKRQMGKSQLEVHAHQQKWYVKDKEEGWENDTTGKMIEVVKSGAAKPLSRLANQKYKSVLTNGKDGDEYAGIISKVNADVDARCKNKVKEAVSDLCNIPHFVKVEK